MKYALIAVALLFAAFPLAADVPGVITYQGFLAEDGTPVHGTRSLNFHIYDIPSGGVALWSETHVDVAVEMGVFSVRLGSVTPLDALSFDSQDHYLTFQIDGQAEMDPRIEMGAASFALGGVPGTPGPQGPLTVIGHIAVGFDVIAGLEIGESDMLQRENNARIGFDDTSILPGNPANDWWIEINDNANGGLSYFGIFDMGLGSATDTTTQPMVFAVVNEAPESALYLSAGGDIGLATGTPAADLHISRSSASASIRAQAGPDPSNTEAQVQAGEGGVILGSVTDHPLVLTAGDAYATITAAGQLSMSNGGSYDGTWNSASRRSLKRDITPLGNDEALGALLGLVPVTYRYRSRPAHRRVGYIAEDVPALVASPRRENISEMDMTAVLTGVIKRQRAVLAVQEQELLWLLERLEELENGTYGSTSRSERIVK